MAESRAVHHASHGAVQLDVVQAILGRFHLERVFLVQVPQLAKLLVPEEPVIVECHFRVERHDLAVARHHARVDLHQRRIRIDKRPI